MSSETPKVNDSQVVEVEAPKVDNSEVLKQLAEMSKQIAELRANKFDASEINAIAKQKTFERSVEMEQGFLESEKIQKIMRKGQTDLQIRNAIWDACLDEFLNGGISPNIFKKIDTKQDEGLSQLLGACLYKYLAPKYGISEEYINNTSLIQAEKEFNWKNNPANLIRTFRG